MVRLVIAVALILGLTIQVAASAPRVALEDDVGCCVATGCEVVADDDVAHHVLVTLADPPAEARHMFGSPFRSVEGPHLPGPFHPPRQSA